MEIRENKKHELTINDVLFKQPSGTPLSFGEKLSWLTHTSINPDTSGRKGRNGQVCRQKQFEKMYSYGILVLDPIWTIID